MIEGEAWRLVTLKGECFETVFQRTGRAQNRDGVSHLFHITDLTDKRKSKLLVSLHRFGPKDLYASNYDARLEAVLLNAIRRAFDTGTLSFDESHDEHTYREVPLTEKDFQPQAPASGHEIQELIRHEAYWLGFRHNPNPGYPLQLDSPTDLEYLGVNAADVRRYVLLLGQRGLLEKIMEGLARPTDKLIDAYESQLNAPIEKKTSGLNEPDKSLSLDEPHQGLLVFISHSSKDADLALALIDLLKAGLGLLAHQIRCSSVDGYRLPVGVNTEEKLRKEVTAAQVVIGLITPSSLKSYFVMFELGARWGANLFLAPLLAGVPPSDLKGPLSLLNALSASNESQLHQLITDISKQLRLSVQDAASYVRHIKPVKDCADAISNSNLVTPAAKVGPKTELKVTFSADGTPPSQTVKIIASEPIKVSRLEYMTSNETCIAAGDVSFGGDVVEIPVNYDALTQLWNTPRSDRNNYDHSGPAKIGITVSVDGKTRQYILPIQMEALMSGNVSYRKIIGSKTFYGL